MPATIFRYMSLVVYGLFPHDGTLFTVRATIETKAIFKRLLGITLMANKMTLGVIPERLNVKLYGENLV